MCDTYGYVKNLTTTSLAGQIELYLEWKSTHTSRAFINYRPWLVKFAKCIGDKSVTDITLADVVKYRKWLDEKYQPYTIQLAMVAIHNFFKFWNIQRVECLAAGLVRVPRTRPKARPVVTNEDYTKMTDFYKGKDQFPQLRDQLIVRLLWDTGVRVSELCDMNVTDIDVEKTQAVVRTRKSDRMRQVFWSPETHALMRVYLQKRTALSTSPGLLVGFRRNMTTGRLKTRSVQRLVIRLTKELALGKKVTPHSFRHGKAHRILDLGGNPKHIQAILGHSETNPAAAFNYIQWNNRELESAAKRFLATDSTKGEDGSNVVKYD